MDPSNTRSMLGPYVITKSTNSPRKTRWAMHAMLHDRSMDIQMYQLDGIHPLAS